MVKRATFGDFVAKSRMGFYFLQHTFGTCSTPFCCETGFVLGMKNAQHLCSTRFAAMLRDELHIFVSRITVALQIPRASITQLSVDSFYISLIIRLMVEAKRRQAR